jgi:histone H3/H4
VPEVIERRRVTLIERGLPTQPYEHDTRAMREDEAMDLVARVNESVSACTARALERVVSELAPTCTVVGLAIRKPPFPSIPKSVAAVHASYPLLCSADGMMYQLAICRAAERLKLAVQLCKRGEETARAAEQLGVTPDDVENFVGRSGRPAGPPWTQEHRRAFAAGIAALAPHVRRRLSLHPAHRSKRLPTL